MASTATTTELAESFHQFVAATQAMGRAFPEADQRERPGMTISWPNIQFRPYNQIILTDRITDARVLRLRVREAATYIRTREVGGLLIVCLDYLEGSARACLGSVLSHARFAATADMEGMAGEVPPFAVPAHHTLRFVRITDRTDARGAEVRSEWAALKCVAYDYPLAWGRALGEARSLWRGDAVGFVAYEGDRPVSTATALILDDCLYLSGVATAPDARGKGYAEAVVRRTLQTAYELTGIRRTVLHTTAAGRSLYERLGYHTTNSTFLGCTLITSPAMPAVSPPPR
jgi:GNAT superfamily N-acetyltransferase